MQTPPDTVPDPPDPPAVRVRARTVSFERPSQRRNSSPNMKLPLLDEEGRLITDSSSPPKGIKPNHPLSKSMVNPNSAEADSIRERFRKAQALAILEGLDHGAAGRAAWLGKRRLVFWLSATALLSGTVAQTCNELIFRADPEAGDTVSLVEYGTAAILSAGALHHPRRLPWRCHAILFAAGLLYSKLMNAGLAVRCLPMPLVLVMKNANILANMAVGRAAGKRYSLWQLAAAAVLTAGLVLSALGGRHERATAMVVRVGAAAAPTTAAASAVSARAAAASTARAATASTARAARAARAARVRAAPRCCRQRLSDGGGDGGGLAFALGAMCLGDALLARATGGVAQERAFEQHGIHCGEVRPCRLHLLLLHLLRLVLLRLHLVRLHSPWLNLPWLYLLWLHSLRRGDVLPCGPRSALLRMGRRLHRRRRPLQPGWRLGLGLGLLASAPAAAAVMAEAAVAVPRLYLLLAGNVVGDYCCLTAAR